MIGEIFSVYAFTIIAWWAIFIPMAALDDDPMISGTKETLEFIFILMLAGIVWPFTLVAIALDMLFGP